MGRFRSDLGFLLYFILIIRISIVKFYILILQLLLKLDPLDKLYRDDLKRAVDAITAGTDLQQFCSKPDKPHIKKSVKFAADAMATKNNKVVLITSDFFRWSTCGWFACSLLFSLLKQPKEQLLSKLVLEKPEKIAKLKKKSEDSEESDEEMEDDGQDVEERKRAVTYQIAKNKGTTPYRKKEYRNPRVKHRIKYRKALIRRKGQVSFLVLYCCLWPLIQVFVSHRFSNTDRNWKSIAERCLV